MKIFPGPVTEIYADEGMMLTDDGVNFVTHLCLGIYDSPSNWHEVPIEEVPSNGEPTTNYIP